MLAQAETLDGELVEGYYSLDYDGRPCIDMFDVTNTF